MDELTEIKRELTRLKIAVEKIERNRANSKTIEALQKEIYGLKAQVADLKQHIYLMNYKSKQ